MTDQSQIYGASIVEMAKRFGIDAIINLAEKRNIENESLKNKLYGNDFTKLHKSKEELLNTKRRVAQIFEQIPARIRKEMFNDDVVEFVNAYTTNDEKKVEKLTEIGLVSKTQFENLKQYNLQQENIAKENKLRENFVNALNEVKGTMYENYKKTGTIDFNSQNNDTGKGNSEGNT